MISRLASRTVANRLLLSHVSVCRVPEPMEQRRNFTNETVVGFWKTLSHSTPVAYVQEGLLNIHDYSGLPWWATIVLSTFLFRTAVTLPLAIYSTRITSKIENLTLEMPALVKELKAETAFGIRKYKWTEKKARMIYNRSVKKQWDALIVRDNCHPAKTLILLWGQIPLWIFQSAAIRNLVHLQPDPTSIQAQIAFTELTVGGFGWIPNLTDVDHSFILPVALGLINLSIIQLQVWMRSERPSGKVQKIATNFFRVFSVAMIPISSMVPSVLCVYWVSSSTYGLLQNLLIASPKVRRLVGIPKTKSELEAPYSHLSNIITTKLGLGNGKIKQV
ncbi:COX18 family protein [Megaselia abdita]